MRNLSTTLLLLGVQLMCGCAFAGAKESKIAYNVHVMRNTTPSQCTTVWRGNAANPTSKTHRGAAHSVRRSATSPMNVTPVHVTSQTNQTPGTVATPTSQPQGRFANMLNVIRGSAASLMNVIRRSEAAPISQTPNRTAPVTAANPIIVTPVNANQVSNTSTSRPGVTSCGKCVIEKTTNDCVCQVCYSYYD